MRLRVPGNINIRKEIWKGLSYADGAKVIVVLAVASIVGITYVNLIAPSATLWATMAVLAITAFSFLMLQRLDMLSPYDLIKLKLKYTKEQQRFLYTKGDLE